MRYPTTPFESSDENHDTLINLTPLIDVVFVVLIMFILIAPLVKYETISLAEGAPSAMNAKGVSNPIVIVVQKDDTLLLNGKKVSLIDFDKELKKLKLQFPKSIPQLQQDEHSHFGAFQKVKNTIHVAGFEEIELLLK